MKTEDSNERRAVEIIKKALDKALEPAVGERLNENLIDDVRESILHVFESMEGADLLQDGQNVVESIKSLYSSWSVKRKIIWFLRMRLGFSKREYRAFKQYQHEFASSLFALKEEVEDEDEKNLLDDEIEMLLSDFNEKFKKWWYVTNPKRIMICDIKVTPVAPVHHMIINNKIDLY